MNDVEKILRHMFHSRYTFFRPYTIAQRNTGLSEKRVTYIIESMERSGVVKTISLNNSTRYFLTPASRWIFRNLLGWDR